MAYVPPKELVGLTAEQERAAELDFRRREVELAEKRFDWDKKFKIGDFLGAFADVGIPILVFLGIASAGRKK